MILPHCIYLLHTSGKPQSENVAGAVKILYEDGTYNFQYIIMDKQLTYWWFSELKTDYSGIAWYGKNDVSEGVGVSWCAIDNPHPEKKIKSLLYLHRRMIIFIQCLPLPCQIKNIMYL